MSVAGSLCPLQLHSLHSRCSSGSGHREAAGPSDCNPSVVKSGSLSESAWCSSWWGHGLAAAFL